MKRKALLVLLSCMVAFGGCGRTETETPEETPKATETPTETPEETPEATETPEETETPAATGDLTEDIYDFQISIDGTVYQFPMKYSDFVSQGWTYDGDEEEGLTSGNYTISDWFKKDSYQVMTYLVNFDISELPLNECYIGGIDAESSYIENTEVLMAKGIKLGESTQDDVKAAYGEPTDSYESDTFPTMTYTLDYSQEVSFSFDVEAGGILNGIDIQNLTEPENMEKSEVSTETPEAVSAYKTPDSISDDFLDYTTEFAGNLYKLPAPVSTFLSNGWTIIEDETEATIDGKGSGKVTMMKDNQQMWTYVSNYSENATSYENCFVTQVAANINTCNVPMTIAKGVAIGTTQADLEAALEGLEVEKEDRSGYINYDVTDPASATYGYEIVVRDGAVSGIDMQFDPRYDEYMDSLGQ